MRTAVRSEKTNFDIRPHLMRRGAAVESAGAPIAKNKAIAFPGHRPGALAGHKGTVVMFRVTAIPAVRRTGSFGTFSSSWEKVLVGIGKINLGSKIAGRGSKPPRPFL